MLDLRYLKFFLLAAAACAFVAFYMGLRGVATDTGVMVYAFLFGVAFCSLVIIRLPVFRQYFHPRSQQEWRKCRSYVNQRAAPVMVGVVAGLAAGAGLHLLDVARTVEPAFIAAVSAGVMSHYHETSPPFDWY